MKMAELHSTFEENAAFIGRELDALKKANAAMLAVLYEVEDYLDGRCDVIDGDYGHPAPNKEMRLLTEVHAAIAKAERRS